MAEHILITGGAGFLGSHLSDRLLGLGHRVRALDNLSPQVHGDARTRPSYLSADVELQIGDVEDPAAVARALAGVDAVYHFAARVGVGQSMYEIAAYTRTNVLGTAVLLEALAKKPVRRLVVASSMSIYGEGLYRDRSGALVESAAREPAQLRAKRWDPVGADGSDLTPEPTPEWKRPALASVYALSKFDQEQMCHIFGRAYSVPTVALRFFNAYGTRQALSNPYTGVLAIFASRLLNGKPPVIFEDGAQKRDFVSVHDVVEACVLALSRDNAIGCTFNIASGRVSTVSDIARRMAAQLGKPSIDPEVSGDHRVGDIRHCYADISSARERLGFEPRVSLSEGLVELAEWLAGQRAVDRVQEMKSQLTARGLAL
jgi:dTDP-L-rhamnose 4-epimerase